MKFARYLEETQIPEWKRAYIDFKGLKKRIAAIRNADKSHVPKGSPSRAPIIAANSLEVPSYGSIDNTAPTQAAAPTPDLERVRSPGLSATGRLGTDNGEGGEAVNNAPHRLSQIPASVQPGYSTPRFLGQKKSIGKPSAHTTLESLYSALEPLELEFFTFLDHELEKVDQFYNAREAAAMDRLCELKDQLRELADHRKLFYGVQVHPHDDRWRVTKALGDLLGFAASKGPKPSRRGGDLTGGIKQPENNDTGIPSIINSEPPPARDPSEYTHAKRKLKKALREFYRSLELLNDYRILNLTGFRKALKKYEKSVTKYPVQDLYMKEKVDPCRFSFSGVLDDAMRDIENTYAMRFEKGDLKATRKILKSPLYSTSHYFSMFRSGVYVGLAIPVLVSGVYNSFQPHTREMIPEWGPLLEIYATLMIFVVFSILLGINILAWTHARINYIFIFELDVRTAVDIRKYFELPTFLFVTLCYAFWLSFSLVGISDHIVVAPTSWPLIWVIFATILFINPFPIFSRESRYWLIRRISRLVVAGTSPVVFTDFWLGDQFCSLSFSLTHLYTFGCAYKHRWDNVFMFCGSTTHWLTLAIVVSPYVSRLVQSVRRYYDSGLPSHLINGGKYFSSIVTYVAYYVWKSRGAPHDDKTFAAWLAFATISSVYTSSWDLLMDWSFLQRHTTHPLLRSELIYSNNPFIYYFAIVTNTIIRFIWVIYIPINGLNPRVRAVIVAGLEMLRRFQWNFYRLENEQIGNTDQYRATREVPLPYSLHHRATGDNDNDNGDSDIEDHASGGADIYVRGHEVSFHMSKMLARAGHESASASVRAMDDH